MEIGECAMAVEFVCLTYFVYSGMKIFKERYPIDEKLSEKGMPRERCNPASRHTHI